MTLDFSQCMEGVTALGTAIASGLLGNITRKMNQFERRFERIEDHLGLESFDTSFFKKPRQKQKRRRHQ